MGLYKKVKERFGGNILKLTDWLEHSCSFLAIRQGMVMLLPLLIISSLALLAMKFPIPVYQEFLSTVFGGKLLELLEFTYNGITEFFAVLLATSTSISYAMLKRKEMGGKLNYLEVMLLPIITLASLAAYSEIQHDLFSINRLSNKNMLTALIIALISGKLFFMIKKHINLRFHKRIVKSDSIYVNVFEGILSSALIILFFYLFHRVMEVFLGVTSIQQMLDMNVAKVLSVIENRWAEGLFILIATHVMWFFGIHGSYVMESIINLNFSNIHTGIYNETFQNVFVNMGGCGSVLCLVISILLFSRKKDMRDVAKVATPSVLFNISEIVLFGFPVIFNPIFLIPFLCAPFVNYIISYLAIYTGIIPEVVHVVDTTTPILLSGYQATGSWKGVALQLFCIITGICIYTPFVSLFEMQQEKHLKANVKQLIKEYKEQEEVSVFTTLTEREDELGATARYLAANLEKAIEQKELYMLYQPQIDCSDVCTGAEALLRWEHPIAGHIYPPLIIQLAKEKGLLSKLEEFIFDTVAGAIKEIENDVTTDFKVTVNITNKSLEWEGFEDCLQRCVDKHGISSRQMWLEITESDALSSSHDIIDKLKKLKERGYKFLIDDFGMGHTSMLYLQTNYFDVVKLDGSLTRDVLKNDRNREIIASIVHLGRSLNFATVAEYVETREQRGKLEVIGCEAFQGYLYSKPIHLNDLISWMQIHNA